MLRRRELPFGVSFSTKREFSLPSLLTFDENILITCFSWLCFGLGRPITLPAHEITIPDPREQPMLLAIVELARIMARSAQSMYGKSHDSLLFMWKNAREIRKDLQSFALRVRGVLNLGFDASPKPGEVGVCQIMLLLRRTIPIPLSSLRHRNIQ
jgi:hypothetical protein